MSQSLRATIEQPKFTKASIKEALHSKIERGTVWCIVEGATDKKVYEGFFDHKKVKIKTSEEDFNDFVEGKRLSEESWLDVCCGHDFLSLLGYMMVKEDYNGEDKIRPRMIEFYSREDFKTTKLYQSIKQWADSKGVTVLLD